NWEPPLQEQARHRSPDRAELTGSTGYEDRSVLVHARSLLFSPNDLAARAAHPLRITVSSLLQPAVGSAATRGPTTVHSRMALTRGADSQPRETWRAVSTLLSKARDLGLLLQLHRGANFVVGDGRYHEKPAWSPSINLDDLADGTDGVHD